MYDEMTEQRAIQNLSESTSTSKRNEVKEDEDEDENEDDGEIHHHQLLTQARSFAGRSAVNITFMDQWRSSEVGPYLLTTTLPLDDNM